VIVSPVAVTCSLLCLLSNALFLYVSFYVACSCHRGNRRQWAWVGCVLQLFICCQNAICCFVSPLWAAGVQLLYKLVTLVTSLSHYCMLTGWCSVTDHAASVVWLVGEINRSKAINFSEALPLCYRSEWANWVAAPPKNLSIGSGCLSPMTVLTMHLSFHYSNVG